MAEVEEDLPLEHTPTWIVAVVCSFIISISIVAERVLHFLGKLFKRKNQKSLFEALQKVKEELMLLGFISLLLTVLQSSINTICIPERWTLHMLPCSRETVVSDMPSAAEHYHSGRSLLIKDQWNHCRREGKEPLLSLEALHQLHIFIFILALTHVVCTLLTMILGGAKISQWKHWEDSIHKDDLNDGSQKVTLVHQAEFIRDRFKGIGKRSKVLSWLHSFVKQFYGSVTKIDYITMRLGFIMMHCRGNPKFDFHKYMVRALEADFKKVVGISWYLWIFVIIFMLLNINGWHTYFWIAFVPLLLLLAIGAKMEYVITKLAHEVAEKHSAIEGALVVRPSDELFWFHRPKIVLFLIHFILFQNAFEIAYFFWILITYGFHSCIMGEVVFIVPRLIIGVVIQLLCSYSTLPIYAIVTQMGSSFKKAIFDEHVQVGLVDWAQKVKYRRRVPGQPLGGGGGSGRSQVTIEGSGEEIQQVPLVGQSKGVFISTKSEFES